MSALFCRLIRVSLKNFTTKRAGFSPSYSRLIFLHDHVKWCHGLPGIPNDGKVVRLKNSATGSELYLVGTCHFSQKSAETVKKKQKKKMLGSPRLRREFEKWTTGDPV
ncbi:hypothetical protein BVC80_1231g15 [Macleaya cordata]|uniref:Uncharacterized protein n=1 Tax=Macleaya cordata TaxID=56857 RepID=A0A200R2B3_MACCD|nr:hypothetical protein BVC80_1231g15 [Macleaya cordata]